MAYTKRKMRLYMRVKRKQRRESGRCIECGSRKAVKKHVLCRTCLARGKSRYEPTGKSVGHPVKHKPKPVPVQKAVA
jgi:ribosomal protein S14